MYQDMIYAWAVTYRQAGWCVLPARNKRPLISWKEYQHKLPSHEQVHKWFSNAPDDAQIALVTGEVSGVTVIDIDLHKEGCSAKKKGTCDKECESPEDLLAEVGLSMTSRTGSGGYHVFCEYASYVKNSVGLAHPQLDIRSDGGIVILPPSIHGSGNEYAWGGMAPYNQENLNNLMPFPKKYKLQLVEKPKNDWDAIVAGANSGGRNVKLTALVGKLLRGFQENETSAALELARLWNKHKCNPPQSEQDLIKTFNSVARAEFSKEESYGRDK